jgi:hypothetical protein
MEFDEVSVVTRPANQHAKIVLFKSDDVVEMTTDEAARIIQRGEGRLVDDDDDSLLADEDWDELLDNDELAPEVVAKMDAIGEEAYVLGANLEAELDRRARRVISKDDSLTYEQAYAKVLNDHPDFFKAMRAVAIAKAQNARVVSQEYVQDMVDIRNDAMLPIYEEADARVRDGMEPTREQAVQAIFEEEPELYIEMREAFRQP